MLLRLILCLVWMGEFYQWACHVTLRRGTVFYFEGKSFVLDADRATTSVHDGSPEPLEPREPRHRSLGWNATLHLATVCYVKYYTCYCCKLKQ
uniref:Secreted protein n=1 Tax=Ixodes ricinus TaxID=34613 RepID=A0A6B0UHA6_IXORI